MKWESEQRRVRHGAANRLNSDEEEQGQMRTHRETSTRHMLQTAPKKGECTACISRAGQRGGHHRTEALLHCTPSLPSSQDPESENLTKNQQDSCEQLEFFTFRKTVTVEPKQLTFQIYQ